LLRDPLEQAFELHHLSPPVDTVETLSVQITLSYVQCTQSLAVLPSSVARYYQGLGLIHILPIELFNFKRPIGVLWNAQKPLIPSAQHLISCLEEAINLRQREFE
jgi:DNA-binding transcriptional LysR family regulator